MDAFRVAALTIPDDADPNFPLFVPETNNLIPLFTLKPLENIICGRLMRK